MARIVITLEDDAGRMVNRLEHKLPLRFLINYLHQIRKRLTAAKEREKERRKGI